MKKMWSCEMLAISSISLDDLKDIIKKRGQLGHVYMAQDLDGAQQRWFTKQKIVNYCHHCGCIRRTFSRVRRFHPGDGKYNPIPENGSKQVSEIKNIGQDPEKCINPFCKEYREWRMELDHKASYVRCSVEGCKKVAYEDTVCPVHGGKEHPDRDREPSFQLWAESILDITRLDDMEMEEREILFKLNWIDVGIPFYGMWSAHVDGPTSITNEV